MRRKKYFGILPLVLGAVLTGCTQNDAWETAGRSGKEVRLTVSSGGMASENGGATRADDGQYTAATGFAGGEKVMIYMKGTATTSAVYDVGAPDANKKSALTVASGSTELEYPEEGDVMLYGVYPSTSTTSHVVKHDQTSTTAGNANYKASDLMFAPAVTVTQAQQNDDQELTFNHQLVKLKITVNKAASIGQVTGVTMNNVLRKVPVTAISESGITLGTATAAVSGDADYDGTAATNNSILFGKEETASASAETYTYVCVFPAQSWSDTDFLTVDTDGGSVVYTTSHSFVAGKEYSVTLDIDDSSLNMKVALGNWTSAGAVPVTVVEN